MFRGNLFRWGRGCARLFFWERGERKQRCREGIERVGVRIRKMEVKSWRREGFEVVGGKAWVRDGAVAVGEWEGGMMW